MSSVRCSSALPTHSLDCCHYTHSVLFHSHCNWRCCEWKQGSWFHTLKILKAVGLLRQGLCARLRCVFNVETEEKWTCRVKCCKYLEKLPEANFHSRWNSLPSKALEQVHCTASLLSAPYYGTQSIMSNTLLLILTLNSRDTAGYKKHRDISSFMLADKFIYM